MSPACGEVDDSMLMVDAPCQSDSDTVDVLIEKEETQPFVRTRPLVVLVGPPGSGKTTIGRRLARALHTEFNDSDLLIEQACEQRCGEVFSELGEEEFRKLEARVIAEALHKPGVLSLGGGAVTTLAVRQLLRKHNVVWLDVSVEEGVRRTKDDDSRPVLQAEDPVARYREIQETRRPMYKEVSDFRVRTELREPQKIVADVLGFVESLND